MFRVILIIVSILCAYLIGDWKNWQNYYPTILYFIICSFIYDILFYNYPLWRYEPLPPLQNVLCNSKLISLVVSFTVFPATSLIYLPHYPAGKKKYLYILLWVLIYLSIEVIAYHQKGITYHNGWNLWYSALFNILTFTLLRLHYTKPLLAWPISIFFIIFIPVYFGLPLKSIK